MAGGGVVDAGSLKRAHLYEHKITGYFIFSCIIGALGGSLFGYDLGVSGDHLLQNNIISITNAHVVASICIYMIIIRLNFDTDM